MSFPDFIPFYFISLILAPSLFVSITGSSRIMFSLTSRDFQEKEKETEWNFWDLEACFGIRTGFLQEQLKL